MLNVRLLEDGDAAACVRWDEFVAACPAATFFHRSGWQRLIREIFRHRTYFLYAERAGVVEGILPLAHVRSLLFGNGLISLPFAVYGGIAANGEEGLEKARALKPSLILLDVVMPGQDGIQILEKLKKDPNTKNIVTLMLTNIDEEETMKKAQKLGAMDFIIKSSASEEDLLAIVNKYFKKNQGNTLANTGGIS